MTVCGTVWRWRELTSDDHDANGQWRDRLAPWEIHRAAALPVPAVRAAFVAARDLLRTLVAQWSGVSPAEVIIERTEAGAPRIAGYPEVGCSISHAGAVAVVALRTAGPVGIDIEPVNRPLFDVDALVPVACTGAEGAAIRALPVHERTACFLSLWTGKEAVLKALGVGLQTDPRTVAVFPPDQHRCGHAEHAGQRWQLQAITDIPGYVVTLAVPDVRPPATIAS
jgi:4'-phosphopantetheinyl transferase